jgi:hypothetical protein
MDRELPASLELQRRSRHRLARYPSQTYSNLWVITLDADGQCRRFVEWWMEQPTEPASAGVPT